MISFFDGVRGISKIIYTGGWGVGVGRCQFSLQIFVAARFGSGNSLNVAILNEYHGAWLYGVHRTRRDSSSFTWLQLCNN